LKLLRARRFFLRSLGLTVVFETCSLPETSSRFVEELQSYRKAFRGVSPWGSTFFLFETFLLDFFCFSSPRSVNPNTYADVLFCSAGLLGAPLSLFSSYEPRCVTRCLRKRNVYVRAFFSRIAKLTEAGAALTLCPDLPLLRNFSSFFRAEDPTFLFIKKKDKRLPFSPASPLTT